MNFPAGRLFLLVAAALSLSAPGSAAGPTVSAVEGEAVVRFAEGGEWVVLSADTPLEPGDRLRAGTGARVSLTGADGDAWELGEVTDVEVGPAGSLRLNLGGLLTKIVAGPEKKFDLRTPAAVVSVRGTEFVVDVDTAGASQVAVSEGAVGVSSADAAAPEEIRLAAGESGAVRSGEKPERLPGLTPRLERHVARFEAFRARAPLLRERLQDVPPARRREIRRALQERWNRLPPQQRRALRQRWERHWPQSPRRPTRERR